MNKYNLVIFFLFHVNGPISKPVQVRRKGLEHRTFPALCSYLMIIVILTSSDTFNKFTELHVHFKSTSQDKV